jgi:hypothetical protein
MCAKSSFHGKMVRPMNGIPALEQGSKCVETENVTA